MELGDILKHYSSPMVKEAIFDYCKSRWVALEGVAENSRVFVRYFGKKPLRLDNANALLDYMTRYKHLNPRTVYASINVYGKLDTSEDIDNPSNIVAATPFWDIDVDGLENWRLAIEAAKIIIDFLTSRYGSLKSLYIVWSGEGAHVRIHEKAIPPEFYETYSPVDVAYAIVEYVLDNVRDRIAELAQKSGGRVKVENLIDPKRVFTAPLSIHRKHDLVAVVIDVRNVDSFDISWANIKNFKTDDSWRYFSPGEAEALVRDAIKILSEKRHRHRVSIGAAKKTHIEGDIDRFNVMAVLQAARYYLLTGDLERAKSFGLNRAIFYAYLKYYGRFKAYSKRREVPREDESTILSFEGSGTSEAKGISRSIPVDDGVEVSSDGLFMIGGKVQTPDDFDRNVVRKIEIVAPFDIVWEAALKYVSRFPKHILVDSQRFYKHVYEPVRDGFMKKVVEELIEPPQQEGAKIYERRPVNVEPIIKNASLMKWAKKPSSQFSQQMRNSHEENQQ